MDIPDECYAIGIGALVYNYDGDIYASDEGRMLAEMGDRTFRLGSVHDFPTRTSCSPIREPNAPVA
jgi:hypothetical protein